MDALISHLKSTGTGASKLALVERVANGRDPRDCTAEIVAALNAAGHAVTAGKVLTFCAEPEPCATVGTVGVDVVDPVDTKVDAVPPADDEPSQNEGKRSWPSRHGRPQAIGRAKSS